VPTVEDTIQGLLPKEFKATDSQYIHTSHYKNVAQWLQLL